MDLAWALVLGEQVGHVGFELVGGRGFTGLGDHPRDDPLAEVVVWLRGPGPLGARRMLEQGPLDLAGADPVTARFDQVGALAPDELDRALRVAGGHVAG